MALTLRRRSSAVVAVIAAALSWAVAAPAASTPPRSPAALVDPALRAMHGTVGVVITGARSTEQAVVKAGGSITRELPIIGGYSAKVPANDITTIARVPGVRAVTYDRPTYVQSTPVGAGVRSRTWTVAMPPAGAYEFRLFVDSARAATSPTVTVASIAPPTLTVGATSVLSGATITVTLTNGVGGATDWLGFASSSAPDTSYLQYVYVGAGIVTKVLE